MLVVIVVVVVVWLLTHMANAVVGANEFRRRWATFSTFGSSDLSTKMRERERERARTGERERAYHRRGVFGDGGHLADPAHVATLCTIATAWLHRYQRRQGPGCV